jgi:hypothetical protein
VDEGKEFSNEGMWTNSQNEDCFENLCHDKMNCMFPAINTCANFKTASIFQEVVGYEMFSEKLVLEED